MGYIADIFLISGALGASLFCIVLSRRLVKLNNLETGLGGAVALMTVQVDDMTRALENAKLTASHSSKNLEDITVRAEIVAQRLELLIASLHDIPEAKEPANAKKKMARPMVASLDGKR